MFPLCLCVLAMATVAMGAPAQAPAPIFRNECKDPSLNDCPVETSTCYDLAYEYMCICKPGLVDRSPDKKHKPGRVCVPEGSVRAVAPTLTGGPDPEASVPPAPPPPEGSETGTNEEATELPTGNLKVDETKEGFPKSLSADDASRDDGNSTAVKSKSGGGAKSSTKSSTDRPSVPSSRLGGKETKDTKDSKSGADTGSSSDTNNAEMKEQFKAIDTNQDGKVNLVELTKALSSNSMKFPDDRIKSMLKAADSNNDGSVNFDEFQALLKE